MLEKHAGTYNYMMLKYRSIELFIICWKDLEMGLFDKLFKKRNVKASQEQSFVKSEKCEEVLRLKAEIDERLGKDAYIAKSEYLSMIPKYKDVVNYFNVLIDSGSIENYCKTNGISSSDVKQICALYESIEESVEEHNEKYLLKILTEEKDYLDNILKDVDPNILLDEEQRRVVLNDEDYCLVIAGAGAGKTTTVAAKVRYLVEKKQIDPSQILVISFTNKAVQELQEKINKDLKIDCPISTFHSTGYAILNRHSPEKFNIVDSSKLYFVIQDYFRGNILKDEVMVKNLIMFFASYFDAPYNEKDLNTFFNRVSKANFATLKSDLNEYEKQIMDTRSKKKVTIQNEILRSNQEVEIANFLYLNNIEYEYEPIYRYNILLSRKPYTPDFIIKQGDKVAYIEHFGITEDGKNDRYTETELLCYKKAVNDKILLHKEHGTDLIYTFSAYKDKRELIDHLREELLKKGFVLEQRPDREVLIKLIESEENRYIRKLVSLICRFISNFKTNGYSSEEFDSMRRMTTNVRTKLFLDICQKCYLEYERYLREYHAIDFEDMINDSARILKETKDSNGRLDFKYVIVDEYQDISKQRFDLVQAITDVCSAKIVAVGDDWQSIYAFSGADITLFTKFAEKMGYASLLKITKTYRNSQQVIDIAGNFIQQNDEQIKKDLKSPKNITDPVIIYTYDTTRKQDGGDRRSGASYALASAVQAAIEQIIEYNRIENKPEKSSILLLGRFGFDGDQLEKSGLFEYDNKNARLKSVNYPNLNITFMTAHASKGLGYDNVIVVNGKNETYGFPSKIEDDPVLSYVIKGDRSIDYAEERRLFYVAMTRTKNRVFFVAPEKNPSEFLLEIKRDYKNVVLKGNWNEVPPLNMGGKKKCPICGYPMQLRYKNAYGLKLYICSNDPEICNFMTNDYSAGKMAIMKCEHCQDGFLIVKHGPNNDYFLGCSNYKANKKGCNHVISKNKYYEMMRYEADKESVKMPVNCAEKITDIEKCIVEKDVQSHSRINNLTTEQQSIEKPSIEGFVYKQNEVIDIVHDVLQGLVHISQKKYYGVHMLADLLHGADTQKLSVAELNKLPEYGKLSYLKKFEILVLIEWMIEKKFILQTKGKYPVLHPTYEGNHYKEIITEDMLKDLMECLKNGRNVEKQ